MVQLERQVSCQRYVFMCRSSCEMPDPSPHLTHEHTHTHNHKHTNTHADDAQQHKHERKQKSAQTQHATIITHKHKHKSNHKHTQIIRQDLSEKNNGLPDIARGPQIRWGEGDGSGKFVFQDPEFVSLASGPTPSFLIVNP